MEERGNGGRPNQLVIFAISGSGNKAGKSTLAAKLSANVWSLANAIRHDLQRSLPQYDWFNKDSDYKNRTQVKERDSKTLRQVMIEHGQLPCLTNPTHWADKLCRQLKLNSGMAAGFMSVAIDDIRKVCEIQTMREFFPGQIIHFHIDYPGANKEPEFQNDELKGIADYVLNRNS